ncbi:MULTISPECIES: hypothetical protein [unclassified Cryobacterium]|uniref:hypothetical protein n=1 Tax=unclassified Cryobacterium TaxID=2649013 RepID=UPI001447987C|nr:MULTISPECIES: hypothetical protein [unclassified Cryobacterium]
MSETRVPSRAATIALYVVAVPFLALGLFMIVGSLWGSTGSPIPLWMLLGVSFVPLVIGVVVVSFAIRNQRRIRGFSG